MYNFLYKDYTINGDYMNKNNELLSHIYNISDMGVKSTTSLINILKTKDNKIKSILEYELKKYEEIYKESKKLVKKENITPKGTSMMLDIMTNIEMKTRVLKDNSDSAMAGLLIEGFNMGIIETEKKLKDYKDSERNIIKLASRLLKFQKEEIDKLKEYL